MTAISTERSTVTKGCDVRRLTLDVYQSVTIYKGTIVCKNATGYAVPATTTTGLICLGMAEHGADNSSGSSGDLEVDVKAGVFKWANSAGGDAITSAQVGTKCFLVDNQTVAKTSNSGARSFAGIVVHVDADGVYVYMSPVLSELEDLTDVGAANVSIADSGALYTATDVEAALAEVKALADAAAVAATLASTANGDGASLIAVEDPDDLIAATDVEAAIVELAGRLCTAVVAAADVSGGGTDSALTVDLKSLNGAALAKTGIVKITVATTQYDGEETLSSTSTFASATKGSILSSGSGFAIVKCDASGQFACTLANSADETAYISASTPDGGVDALANGVIVVGCVPDDATWAS